MNKIDLEKLLDGFAEDIKNDEDAHPNEDNSYENSSYRNNIAQIRNALAKGRIDSEIVTEDMIRNFISDGLDFIDYEESVKEYCTEKGIDYEEYKADRKQIIDQLSENSPKPQIDLRTKRIAHEIERELSDDMGNDYVTSLKEKYPRQYDYYNYILEQYGNKYPDAFELDDEDKFLVTRIKEMLGAKHGKDFVNQIRAQHPRDYDEYLLQTYDEEEVNKYEEQTLVIQIEKMLKEKHGETFVNQIREQHLKGYNQYLIDMYEYELYRYEEPSGFSQEAPVGPAIVFSKKRTSGPKSQKPEDVASGIEVQESENGDIEPELQEPEDVVVGEVEEFLKDTAQQAALPENVDIKNNWMSLMRNWIKNITNTIKNTFQR